MARRVFTPWLFSPAFDLGGFLVPPLVSLLLCALLVLRGGLSQPLGPLGWLLAVVFVDAAHVYATAYRVYLNPAELRRRPFLYSAVPIGCYLGGVLLHSVSALVFWRTLAYLAVWHFVRQQVGWIKLSHRRDESVLPHLRRLDRGLDLLAIYVGTLYPIVHWHSHLPRRISWFVDGDFVRWLPPGGSRLLWPLYVAVAALWLLRQLQRVVLGEGLNPSKLFVMMGTWATWYVGIIALDSDVAFTLTNVLSHGIPYVLLVFRYRQGEQRKTLQGLGMLGALLVFYAPLALVAFFEEGLWDRLVWHDHSAIYPFSEVELSSGILAFLSPLLALPQVTHYLLDGWIWRGRENPDLGRNLGLESAS